MNDFQEHTDCERAAMAALSYIGLALAALVLALAYPLGLLLLVLALFVWGAA